MRTSGHGADTAGPSACIASISLFSILANHLWFKRARKRLFNTHATFRPVHLLHHHFIFLEPMCSHDLPMTCEKFYHEIPTTMFIISFSLLYQRTTFATVPRPLQSGRHEEENLEQREEKRAKWIEEHAAETERRDDGRRRFYLVGHFWIAQREDII